MTGSSPDEIGIPTIVPDAFADGCDGAAPVRGGRVPVTRPGAGGPALAGDRDQCRAGSCWLRPRRRPSPPPETTERSFDDRALRRGAGEPSSRRSAGPPRAGSAAGRGERVVGQGRRSARDRVVRHREPNLSWSGRTSTNELDERGAADESEDEAERQETEFARRHAVRIPRLVLLRLRGIIAAASVAASQRAST